MGARVRRESGWEEGALQAAGMATKQQIKTEHDMDGECQSDRLVFPMAALTHCYKHSALKQHEFILFTVLELRSLDSVSTSSSQGVLKGCFLLGALRGSSISLTFFLICCCSSALLGLWLLPSSSKQVASLYICHHIVFSSGRLPSCFLFPRRLSYLPLIRTITLHPAHPDNFRIISRSQDPYHIHKYWYSQVLGMKTRTFWGEAVSASHRANGRKWVWGSKKGH